MGAGAQTTIRVPLDYPTIQGAINAAATGDTVLVAPGTYVENINFSGKAITVTSEGGPEVTLLDGNQADSVVKFISGEGRSAVLSGFSVLNGRSGFDTPGFGNGGGIWINNASPTIVGNIVANNRGCDGVGISSRFGSPLIQRNTIANNRREGCSGGSGGGGINITNDATPRPPAEILDNVISGNILWGGDGGGISVGRNVTIRGNSISGNSATGVSPCARGGGISAAGDATIVQNVIAGNQAGCGGAIYLASGAPGQLVAFNTIADNDAPQGSGIYFESFAGGPPEPTNNTIVGKAGQTAVTCLAYNGLGPPVFRANNVYGATGAAYGGVCTDQTGINGNVSSDPLFVDPAGGNYRLQMASPSIDAGLNTASQIPARDFDGNARNLDGDSNGTTVVDIGAYERTTMVTPGSHDFGRVDLGSAPASRVFSITNSGATPLVISSISIGNRAVGAGGPAGFAVSTGGTDPCPSLAPTLAPGQHCSVLITFTSPETVGGKGASLRVVSDAAGSPAVAALLAEVIVDTVITSSPPQRTVASSVNFTFSSNVEGLTFECKIDASDFFPCESPMPIAYPLGPHTLQVRAVSKFGDPDPTPASYLWEFVPRAKHADFDGNGRSDILWRNSATGENYRYPMYGRIILETEGYLRTVADLNWKVAGIGDFDGDGKADVLWRNSGTGGNYIYFMDGSTIKPTEGYIRTVADQSWQVAGIGDFNGDGIDDIVWRNSATGENYIYLMDGLTILGTEGYIRKVIDQSWQVAGVGDFDHDGRADVLWRNSSTGENYIYFMDGIAIKPDEGYIRTVVDQNWQVAGVGDFDGDGSGDILWRNAATGENYIYPMDGKTILGDEGYLRTVPDQSWHVKGTGDYDGDGTADILWRHAVSGENYYYPLFGTTIRFHEGYIRTVPLPNWQIQNPR